jgi:hypothetical protein
MRHAIVNPRGDGYVLTSDAADLDSVGQCDIDGAAGILIRETLAVVEGFWDGMAILEGQFVADVCLPLDPYVGSHNRFKIVAEGTYLCLSPLDEDY